MPVPPSRRGRGQRDECLLWPAGRAALLTPADLARGVPSRAACPFPGWVSAILGGRAAEAAVGCRAPQLPVGRPGQSLGNPVLGHRGKGGLHNVIFREISKYFNFDGDRFHSRHVSTPVISVDKLL